METAFRAALLAWLRSDPVLAAGINLVSEEAPTRAHHPWLALVASASADWSTKCRKGRELRCALELQCRADDSSATARLVESLEARIEAMPRTQPGFAIANILFLRSRAEQRPGNVRATLVEYRFRLLAA